MTREAIGRTLITGAAVLIVTTGVAGLSVAMATFTGLAASWSWNLVNPLGFGPCHPLFGCDNVRISSLVAYGGQLYAGTGNSLGAEIWQYNGTAWNRQVQGGLGDQQNSVIVSMAAYAGKLYAGTQQSESAGAEVWASTGVTWTRVLTGGFDLTATPNQPKNTAASALAIFGGRLYIGTRYDYAGAQVWVYDGISVTQVVSNGLRNAENVAVVAMTEFSDHLYAGTLNYRGAELWRTANGVQWTRTISNGFDGTANIALSALAVMSDTIYAGTENTVTGAEIWRSSDGLAWERILTGGLGDSHFYKINALVAYKGMLYAAISHDTQALAEVWAYDGQTWQRAASGGLTHNSQLHTFHEARCLAVLNNVLYLGTSEAQAGSTFVGPEVWSTGGPIAPTPTVTASRTIPASPSVTPSATTTPSPSNTATVTASPTRTPTAGTPATSTPTQTPTLPPNNIRVFLPMIVK